MDLGIQGKNALVCAASKGLGRGCAEALAEAGVNLTICARTEKDIVDTANEIRSKYKVSVESVACDITTSEGREAALKRSGPVDILINNAGIAKLESPNMCEGSIKPGVSFVPSRFYTNVFFFS